MQPNSEPSAADVNLVAQSMGTPAPAAPEPAAAPAPTPAPSAEPTDPFAALFASEPASVPAAEPVSQPAPAPVEPAAPVEAAAPAPAPATPAAEPVAPAAQTDDYQSYEDYMAQVLAGVPAVPEAPDPEKVDQNDPAAIKGFFDDLMNTAVARAQAEAQRTQAIQSAEKQQWDAAMDKYGSLRTNTELRNTVHNIRMANFARGVAMTPTQAADQLLHSLGQQYKRGIVDNQVVTTIESVQPNGGQSGTPVETTLDRDNVLNAVQTGGETALADILDREIKAGRL